jgi:hypothetical protein
MRRRLTAAAFLTVCAVLAAGCRGAGTSARAVAGQSISLDQLSQSASTSAEATSGRFAFDVRTEPPGTQGPLSFSGEGAFDKRSDRAAFSVDMSAFAKLIGGLFSAFAGPNAKDAPSFDDADGWKIDVVQDGKVGYVRFPAVSDRLPAGKSWIRSEGKSVNVDGLELGQLEGYAGTDPRSLLDVLGAAAGEVEAVWMEELRGTETTHYRATIDPSEYQKLATSAAAGDTAPLAEQLAAQADVGPIPVDVWLDGDGLVRKLSLSVSATQPGASEAGSPSMSFELWDYGEDVGIDVPPADAVVDASALDS